MNTNTKSNYRNNQGYNNNQNQGQNRRPFRQNNFNQNNFNQNNFVQKHQHQQQLGKIININDIIKYIDDNKKFINNRQDNNIIENKFIQQNDDSLELEQMTFNKTENITKLTENLNAIFNSAELIRCGTISFVSVPFGVDISFIGSVLALSFDNYRELKENDQIEFVQVFIKKLSKDIKDNYTAFGYDKLGWNIKEFTDNVKNFKLGKNVMRYIADYLTVNIFILDLENDSLIYVGDKIYTKYKKNLFVLKLKDNHFEAIFTKDNTYLDHKSHIIKKIINSRFLVERMDCDFTHEKEEFNFIIGDEDLAKYFKLIDNANSDIIGETKTDIISETKIDNPPKKEVVITTTSNKDDMFEVIDNNLKNKSIKSVVPTLTEQDPNVNDLNSNDDNDSNDESNNEEKKIDYVNAKMSMSTLQEMAKSLNIKLTHKVGNKTVKKTKAILIDEINAIKS